jgi:hypothetical protein
MTEGAKKSMTYGIRAPRQKYQGYVLSAFTRFSPFKIIHFVYDLGFEAKQAIRELDFYRKPYGLMTPALTIGDN